MWIVISAVGFTELHSSIKNIEKLVTDIIHCAMRIMHNYLIESMYNLRDSFDQIDLRDCSR